MAILVGASMAGAAPEAPPRLYGGYYTKERLANARRNCQALDWAAKRREAATAAAKPWIEKSDEELWRMVPGQDLPRCIDITLDTLTTGPRRLGCLKCGDTTYDFAQYLKDQAFDRMPWKVTCPACGVVFPTNDFVKYYESAVDEHGLFNPAKGDRRLLFNTEHPDPKDPLHLFGVDDGFGYIDTNGRSHKYVACYAWRHWRRIFSVLNEFGEAFLCTGERIYAHKAAVLLDRIADVYPSMDWHPYAARGWYHSDGGTMLGKIEGRIWECGIISNIAQAYEEVLSGTDGDEELYAFLKRIGEKYRLPTPKGTRDLFVKNCDDRILRCAAKAMLSGQVYGNEGMHQSAMAVFATALNTNPDSERWFDWIFEPDGGALPAFIVNKMDRDGIGPEGAPAYALMWGDNFTRVANRIADYGAYTKHDVYRDFPQFKACFGAAWNLCVLGLSTPNIGDTGATGQVWRSGVDIGRMAQAFHDTGDAELGAATWRAAGNTTASIRPDLLAAVPEAMPRAVEEAGRKAGPRPESGRNLSGYGLATLESGSGATGTALACYYGRTLMHGHWDQLNFDLLAFGAWLAPDHGNPEYKTQWPSRTAWTLNTLSHNTVVVDQVHQKPNYGGRGRLFKQLPGFGALELECRGAYPDVKEYARTMLLIDAPGRNAYAVDVFEVEGGRDHLMSFHGPPGEVETSSLRLEAQTTGTYAGAGVPHEADANSGGFPLGYSYLFNVKRDSAPPDAWQIDWAAEAGYRGLKTDSEVHLRLHALTPCGDVALAEGCPPHNQPGNPRRLGYVLMHRTGHDLASTFVSVIEPYRQHPFITKVERIGTSAQDTTHVVIQVRHSDGFADIIFWNRNPGRVELGGGTSFDGKLGFVRFRNEQVTSAVLVQGSELRAAEVCLQSKPGFAGRVARMNRELEGGGWIWLEGELPLDGTLEGKEIIIENDGVRNSCYTIRSAVKDGSLVKVYCGAITFVRGYRGSARELRGQVVPVDYSGGYEYDFKEGARFTIANHAVYTGK